MTVIEENNQVPLLIFFISILIEFALSTYASGGFPDMIFTAAVDLVIFGADLFLAVSFNLRDPIGSLRATSDRSTDWYKDKMNQKDATDTETNYYDNPNPYVDFQMSGELHSLFRRVSGQ